MENYLFKRIVVGELETNCFILKKDVKERSGALVIDPGDDTDVIKSTLLEMNAYPALILLTHGHFDHILSVNDLTTARTKVAIHEKDAHYLTERDTFSSLIPYDPRPFPPADILIKKEGPISLCGFDFTVVHTPGHTEGSCCYIFGDVMFSGDTLFYNGIGRTDFFGGSDKDMTVSLKKLKFYPGDYKVYPGHGQSTQLSFERCRNPYMAKLTNE